jgi:mono/diheme cytochrome c family protein
MKKSDLISLTALAALVVGLFVYAVQEPRRMVRAESGLRKQYVVEAAGLYVDYCALCHGADGAGIGAMPAINHPALAEADDEILFRTWRPGMSKRAAC